MKHRPGLSPWIIVLACLVAVSIPAATIAWFAKGKEHEP